LTFFLSIFHFFPCLSSAPAKTDKKWSTRLASWFQFLKFWDFCQNNRRRTKTNRLTGFGLHNFENRILNKKPDGFSGFNKTGSNDFVNLTRWHEFNSVCTTIHP
jgi:hypothetical protein